MGHVTTLDDSSSRPAFVAAPGGYGVDMSNGDYGDLVARLQDVSDAIGDRTMALLREAIESGDGARPPMEKTQSQARRAVDKAISLLAGADVTDD